MFPWLTGIVSLADQDPTTRTAWQSGWLHLVNLSVQQWSRYGWTRAARHGSSLQTSLVLRKRTSNSNWTSVLCSTRQRAIEGGKTFSVRSNKDSLISEVTEEEHERGAANNDRLSLPLGVSIRGGNLNSTAREYERCKSFLVGLMSGEKRQRERESKRSTCKGFLRHRSMVVPRCWMYFIDPERWSFSSSSGEASSWIGCIAGFPTRLFNLQKRSSSSTKTKNLTELPRKNNVRCSGRSCCFTVGHDWIAGLWSLQRTEKRSVSPGSSSHSIRLTLHALSVRYFPPLPSTALTKSLKNLIFTFPSRICNLPMWENVNSTLRWAATERLKICRTCLTHCSIWSRV